MDAFIVDCRVLILLRRANSGLANDTIVLTLMVEGRSTFLYIVLIEQCPDTALSHASRTETVPDSVDGLQSQSLDVLKTMRAGATGVLSKHDS